MSRKWLRKTTASPNAPQSAAVQSIAVLRESEDSHRFSTSAVCHELLHPIALVVPTLPLDLCWRIGFPFATGDSRRRTRPFQPTFKKCSADFCKRGKSPGRLEEA